MQTIQRTVTKTFKPEIRTPRRYASIDFLRGLAIFVMLILHVVMTTLNVDAYLEKANYLPFIQFVLLLVLPFLGGLAGLFLMVSAMGNMVSMNRNLEKGHSPGKIVLKQVMGGLLIILFAMLTEAVIGYKGAVGDLIYPGSSQTAIRTLHYRAYHFETIHTIGWAVLVNGLVHGALINKYDLKRDRRKIERIYLVLTGVTLLFTPLVWKLVGLVVPGFPYAYNPETGLIVQYPYFGVSPWYDFISYFFFIALAGHPEPIFPYLAVSFIGSILGINIAMAREEQPREFVKKYFVLGIGSFAIGIVGVFYNVAMMLLNQGFEKGIDLYIRIWDHRYWVPENGVYYWGWLFQFLALNGFSLMLVILTIRLVECRGIGEEFGRKSTFIRRFGFVAFTVYTIQFVYYVFFYLVSRFVYGTTYERLSWPGTLTVMVLTLISFHFLLKSWERIGYIGSIEWMIGTITSYLLPIKKESIVGANSKTRWWKRGKLDVEKVFYGAKWLNIKDFSDINHVELEDLRLAFRLSLAGLVFVPFSILAILLAIHARKLEKDDLLEKRVLALSFLGIIVFLAWFVPFLFVNFHMIGVDLPM